MKQTQENFVSMSSTTMKVLDNNAGIWSSNVPFSLIKEKVEDLHLKIMEAQKGGGSVSTGATIDKEVAVDTAIARAVRLAGFGQAYALDINDHKLHDQLKVSYTGLERLADHVVGPALLLIHKTLGDAGAPIEAYGVTGAELEAFKEEVHAFMDQADSPRVLISERKGHNSSIPMLLRELRKNLYKLDRLIKIWETTDSKFISDYQNARIVIDLGTRHKKKEEGGE